MSGLDLVTSIFQDNKKPIWLTKQSISDDILEHYLQGKSKEDFIKFVHDTWVKNKRLKLLDGSYLTKCETYHPWIYLIDKNTSIIIDALEPEIWNTPEEEMVLPDWMRLERFGIFDESRIKEVEKRFNLRVSLKYKS